jgi:hypothetical protein
MTKTKTLAVIEQARLRALAAMPERLQRLDRELAIERLKDFDTLYATRGEHRFKINIFRHGSAGFVATTKVAGHVMRYHGKTPSDSFAKLTISLRWVTSRLDFEKNVAIAEAKKYEAA